MKIQSINPAIQSFTSDNNNSKQHTYSGLATGVAYTLLATGGLNVAAKIIEEKSVNPDGVWLAKFLKMTANNHFVPFLLVNLACGGIVDYLINKERSDFNENNDANTSDQIKFETHAGLKYGALLGAGVCALDFGIGLLRGQKLPRNGFVIIDEFLNKAIGGSLLGWVADSIANKKLENPFNINS